MVQHIAFICKDSVAAALKKKKKPYEGYRTSFEKINEFIEMQVRKIIPISTYHIMPQKLEAPNEYSVLIDELTAFISELSDSEFIHSNRIKISVLGKWYDLPPRLIDAVKKLIETTKDYDNFFVNLCINYDGQEEIVDAAKMAARRVKIGKIDAENITKEIIKEDLYSSYFLPPDFIFVTGKKHSTYGFLLWDSVDSEIVFLDKAFSEIKVKDVEKILKKAEND